jgi:hypothetical protein
MDSIRSLSLASLLVSGALLGGCGVPLGTPVPSEVDPAMSSPFPEELEETSNPHLGLTAGRLVVPSPAPTPPVEGEGEVDLQSLLDELGPEDSDVIRGLIEGVTGAPQPDLDDEPDDGTLSWGELKDRYAPAS